MFRDQLPPHLTDFAAELRSSTGAEFLDELEITEAETELGRLRKRTIQQVWEAAMHRGDLITAVTGLGSVTGSVDYVGTDYATVVSGDSVWDLRTDRAVISRVRRSTAGGHTASGGSKTFKARLAEYGATGESITVIIPARSMEAHGRIALVAVDHVAIVDQSESITVPIDLIEVVRREI
jgi:hypothetical protein